MSEENKNVVDEQTQKQIDEIEEYYDSPLGAVVIRLAKSPLVRHFKGTYYRVVGVGKDCDTGNPTVIYSPMHGNASEFWVRDLLDFLSPVPDGRDDNVTGQKRRFEFIDDFEAQLDLVDTQTLLNELSKRQNDVVSYPKENVLATDYAIARLHPKDDGSKTVYDVLNLFDYRSEAEENLSRNRRHKKFLSQDIEVIQRVFIRLTD